jgi:hypothetical protein
MGEFLSTPNKDKHSEDNENKFVRLFPNFLRSDMVLVECKDGENVWRTRTYPTSALVIKMVSMSSACSMVMVVSKHPLYI